MIETTRAQFLTYPNGPMEIIGMRLMPPKFFRIKACLQVKVLFNYQKILDTKGAQTFEKWKNKKK